MNKELYTQDFKNSYTATQEILTTYKYLCSVLDIIANNDLEHSKESIDALRQEISNLATKTEQDLDNLTKVIPTDISIDFYNYLNACIPTLYHDGVQLTGQEKSLKNSIPNIIPDSTSSRVIIGGYDVSTQLYKKTPVLNYGILSKFGLYETRNDMNVQVLRYNFVPCEMVEKTYDTDNTEFTFKIAIASNYGPHPHISEGKFGFTAYVDDKYSTGAYRFFLTCFGDYFIANDTYDHLLSIPSNVKCFIGSDDSNFKIASITPIQDNTGMFISLKIKVEIPTDYEMSVKNTPFCGISNTNIEWILSNS